MSENGPISQVPAPGESLVRHCGDVLRIEISLPSPDRTGHAWLRTNLNRAATRWSELIEHVERDVPVLARDWHDIPMSRVSARGFAVTLPLTDVGRFEAKAYFQPDGEEIEWVPGANTIVKVEPAETVASNSIYCAFTRLFGQAGQAAGSRGVDDAVPALDEAGYTVIPRSGTFRDLIGELDHIVHTLGFRTVQLLPIFPTPTTYARMGRFGSPFAALDFMDVDPALAEFDRQSTPLDQFRELCDEVHRRRARLFIDIPVNHTGWGSWLQVHHPEWFARNPDDTFQSPGAWGVTWEDLAELDYRHRALWSYIADVFLFWCRLGVDGFRCDAGYMIPLPVWEYIVARVRREYPATTFLLEGLGGKESVVRALLHDANLDWAYSELFQIYSRDDIAAYLKHSEDVSCRDGLLVHFAETHDNNRLAGSGEVHARIRTALAALCSGRGAFGITCGVEWLAREKIDVHEATGLNWGAEPELVDLIGRLNAILRDHPAFHDDVSTTVLDAGDDILAVRRTPRDGAGALVLLNLSEHDSRTASWSTDDLETGDDVIDLVSGSVVDSRVDGERYTLSLEPGAVMCLSAQQQDAETDAMDRVEGQRARATVLRLIEHFHPATDMTGMDVDSLAQDLLSNPRRFCTACADNGAPVVTDWTWPADATRTVVWSVHRVLLVSCPTSFAVSVVLGEVTLAAERSMERPDGTHVAMLCPPQGVTGNRVLTIRLAVYTECPTHHASELMLATAPQQIALSADTTRARSRGLHAIYTNGRGAMIHARAAWSAIESQYDALLAANLNDSLPVDRHIMLTRCRAWLVYRDYSQELDIDCQTGFERVSDDGLRWSFHVPCGMGKSVRLQVECRMLPDRNLTEMTVRRTQSVDADELEPDQPVTIILRPDVEDRGFHTKTKAYAGAEAAWPAAVTAREDGFVFAPDPARPLAMSASRGSFSAEPEWQYMVAHPEDADRGLEGAGDLFSPGYFEFSLCGGSAAVVHAGAGADAPAERPPEHDAKPAPARPASSLEAIARSAMRDFVVARGTGSTVIAGYPWFLDWGRDTLICLRGMIAAGMGEQCEEIIHQFALFESDGTLPNMIHGDDDSNRDTSDASLWFIVAACELTTTAGERILDLDCGGRPLSDVLLSIGRSYRAGTPNGIAMDPDSGLIFSPAHYTWMDTNFPAATPRQGYPIEIQALWYAACCILAELDATDGWDDLARRVRESIAAFFTRFPAIGLSDCLHASPGQPAAEARADDALRPNQLFAITLGAINDPSRTTEILAACEQLLVPGAIRSLADRPVEVDMPVDHDGRRLNDPRHPYWGHYRGDEDTRRKPAYHNGTAWTWPFPSYAEALLTVYGESARADALAILGSSEGLAGSGCIGQIPEIVDGNAPHHQRGCGAQAWGATELYRVLAMIAAKPSPVQ